MKPDERKDEWGSDTYEEEVDIFNHVRRGE